MMRLNRFISADSALKIAAASIDMMPEEIRSTSRNRENVRARRAVCVAMANEGFGIAEIGRAIHRDHSTVMHHLATPRATIERDDLLRRAVGCIQIAIKDAKEGHA